MAQQSQVEHKKALAVRGTGSQSAPYDSYRADMFKVLFSTFSRRPCRFAELDKVLRFPVAGDLPMLNLSASLISTLCVCASVLSSAPVSLALIDVWN